eukprot:SAG31_NODE_30055_length_386_cov_0.620209_1_plen_74_part_10
MYDAEVQRIIENHTAAMWPDRYVAGSVAPLFLYVALQDKHSPQQCPETFMRNFSHGAGATCWSSPTVPHRPGGY